MVDTLMVADTAVLVFRYSCPVLLMSDDEDLLPGAIVAAMSGRRTAISREKRYGDGLNDALFKPLGIQLEEGLVRL
jgi:hypothetical protein